MTDDDKVQTVCNLLRHGATLSNHTLAQRIQSIMRDGPMHQAHIIEETDGPQYVSVLHNDGMLSELRITPEPDGISLRVELDKGKQLNNFEIEASNATTA